MTIKTLSQVRKFLNGIDDINFGGCGVAALALYRWCKAHGLKPDGFAWLYKDYEADDLVSNENAIQSQELDNLYVPCHVALQLDGLLYDSATSEASNTCRTSLTQPGISESVLLHLLNDSRGWNSYFDRKTQVPIIAKTLDIDLSDVTLTT